MKIKIIYDLFAAHEVQKGTKLIKMLRYQLNWQNDIKNKFMNPIRTPDPVSARKGGPGR